jgi:hypothetical protein
MAPPLAGSVFVTLKASWFEEPPHDQGTPSAPQPSFEKRLRGEQLLLGGVPRFPHPNRSLTPVALQLALPLPLWRVTKNVVASYEAVVQAFATPALAATSAALSHTCQPGAHRSSTEQPAPVGFALSSPLLRPQAGTRLPGDLTPGTDQPPEQAATLPAPVNPSRVPSAHPVSPQSPVERQTPEAHWEA